MQRAHDDAAKQVFFDDEHHVHGTALDLPA
jgi:hypothetical protein